MSIINKVEIGSLSKKRKRFSKYTICKICKGRSMQEGSPICRRCFYEGIKRRSTNFEYRTK